MSDYTKIDVQDGSLVNANGAMLDLGGVVKGYALDSLKDNLDLMDAGPALVSLGGSIYARGTKPDGAPWTIGVRDPFGSDTDYMGTLELSDMCISTSGSYERGFTADGVYYHHIIDPATGYPVDNGLVSVSVMDESGIETDLYSTALFVMGAEKGVEFAREHEISALFITGDKKLYKTGAFADDFQLTDEGYEEL
jgi:thiamine biosynthesis lipoprotein